MILSSLIFAAHLINNDILTTVRKQDLKETLKKQYKNKELNMMVNKKMKQEEQNVTNWFEFNQRTSHFTSKLSSYFPQRYYKKARSANDSYAILYVGGEGPMNFVEYDSIKVRLADSLNATLYALEHRGYGVADKIPLQFITADEAVEDLAFFANSVDPSKKWIIIGGSYSGTLVHYAVLKYPFLFRTGWASSAPLNAKEDFFEYDQIVGQSLPADCREKIRVTTLEMDRVQVEDKAKFGKWKLQLFPQHPNMTDVDFLSYFAYSLSGEVQYNNYGSPAIKFLCSGDDAIAEDSEDEGEDVGESDEEDDDFDWSDDDYTSDDEEEDSDYESDEEGEDDESDGEYGDWKKNHKNKNQLKSVKRTKKPFKYHKIVKNLHKLHQRSVRVKPKSLEFDVDAFVVKYMKFVNMTLQPDDGGDNSMSTWTYQCCTSFGWWQVAPKQNSLRSKLISVEWSRDEYCRKAFPDLLVNSAFPKELPRTDNTNNRYAFTEKLPRVVYTNGEHDPWSGLSHSLTQIDELVQYGGKCGAYAYKISKGSHCNDFYPFRDYDTPTKTKAKLTILETLKTLAQC